jgi:hypothetical protein
LPLSRVVDRLATQYDVVGRFGGGDNVGHTIVVGDRKIALRIVPTGVLQLRPDLFVGGGKAGRTGPAELQQGSWAPTLVRAKLAPIDFHVLRTRARAMVLLAQNTHLAS